jgi:hypothetical protein
MALGDNGIGAMGCDEVEVYPWPPAYAGHVLHDEGEVRHDPPQQGGISQMNELPCKVLRHNICVVIQIMYELGIEADFGV